MIKVMTMEKLARQTPLLNLISIAASLKPDLSSQEYNWFTAGDTALLASRWR
jgi:hypothetical protein